MSEKKRKRPSEKSGTPNKRVAIDAPADVIKVKILPPEAGVKPVIASTPGLDVPSKISFDSYQKSHNARGTELLLHSSEHPVMDYTAREEGRDKTDEPLKHYVGVYNEKTGELQLMEARHMVMRARVRPKQEDSDQEMERLTNIAMRNELGMEFGTKKAKKAIAAVTENAIGRGGEGGSVPTAVQKAILDSMAEATADMPTREDLQAAVQQSHPRPKPNMSATTLAEAYPLDELIGSDELRQVQVQKWVEAVKNKEDVKTRSHFISSRLEKIVNSEDVKMLKVLRYMLLLVDFYLNLKPGLRGGKKLGKGDDWRKPLQVSIPLAESVKQKFTERGILNSWHVEKLILHILALSLVIEKFEIPVSELKDDLKLTVSEIQKYYQELGCKVNPPTEEQKRKYKIKIHPASHKIAKLKLPLEFPRQRVPARRR